MAAVLTQEDLYKKMISNIVEVRTRGAFVMAVTNEDNTAGGEGGGLCDLYPGDQQVLHQFPGDHPAAAFCLLYRGGKRLRCG